MTKIQRLRINGYNALLADHCELSDEVADMAERLAAVEQILAAMACRN